MTTASRALATALSKARVAGGLLPTSYTITGDTTCRSDAPELREFAETILDGVTRGVERLVERVFARSCRIIRNDGVCAHFRDCAALRI